MIITLASWIVLLALSETVSHAISRLLRINLESDDFFLTRQFLGLGAIAFGLLILNIFSAINAHHLLIICVAVCFYQIIKILKSPEFFTFFKTYLLGLIPLGLLLVHLTYSNQTVYLGDTGGYHFGLIKWLSEYGIVNGLAHLEPRFGFNSSWLSLGALINHGILEGRSGAAINGYLFFCCTYQIYLFYKNRTTSLESYFLIIALLLVLPYSIRAGVVLSPSPDFPIHLIGPIAGFIVLKQGTKAYKLLFLVAGIAFNIKLSAVPLILWVTWMYRRDFFRQAHLSIVFGTLLIAPILLANFYSSGYPAYPSTILSFGSDWSLPTEIANQIKSSIYDYAALTPEHWLKAKDSTTAIQKIYLWCTSRYEFITFILITISLISFAYFYYARRQSRMNQFKNIKLLIGLAIAGTAFFMYTAPTIRFGIQWLVIGPAVLLAYIALNNKITILYGSALIISTALPMIFILLPMANTQKLIYSAINQQKIIHEGRSQFNLVLPPKLPNIMTLDDSNGNAQEVRSLTYKTGQYGVNIALGPQCWNTPIPCATQINFELLRPDIGYRGGFKSIGVKSP